MTDSNANTSGLEPVRWLVTVIATGAQDVHEKPLFDTEFNHKRFTCEPLVTAASAQARIAELKAELERWKRLKGYADDQIKVERKAYRSLLADYEARAALQQETQP